MYSICFWFLVILCKYCVRWNKKIPRVTTAYHCWVKAASGRTIAALTTDGALGRRHYRAQANSRGQSVARCLTSNLLNMYKDSWLNWSQNHPLPGARVQQTFRIPFPSASKQTQSRRIGFGRKVVNKYLLHLRFPFPADGKLNAERSSENGLHLILGLFRQISVGVPT